MKYVLVGILYIENLGTSYVKHSFKITEIQKANIYQKIYTYLYKKILKCREHIHAHYKD